MEDEEVKMRNRGNSEKRCYKGEQRNGQNLGGTLGQERVSERCSYYSMF